MRFVFFFGIAVVLNAKEFDARFFRKVRSKSHERLALISRSDRECLESYLFRNDHLCGIRFRQAFFHADWFIGDDFIRVFRDSNEIGRMEIASGYVHRAA